MNLAVIPARGGSKRIPGKNIRPFCGRPMIAWAIDAARDSGLFDRVVVSTDDKEIAETASQAGAEVPFTRPAELADDHAGTIPVIAHATRWAQEQDWPVEATCVIGYCSWQGDGLETVAEVEEAFARACFETDQRLGEPAASRWFLNWYDDTPREEMRAQLLAEVNRILAARLAAGGSDTDGTAAA